jgi:hypothetical protein
MSKESDLKRLLQKTNLDGLLRKVPSTEMLTVYWSDTSPTHRHGIYCALIPNSDVKTCLDSVSWSLHHGDGLPGANLHFEDGKEVATYHRYGFNRGIEPLVIDREFHGVRPDYKEISEEFRLFHRLFHDRKEDKYIKISDSGMEEVIAIIEPKRVQIRAKEMRQFLAIKEMHLAIQFDYVEYSLLSLQKLGMKSDATYSKTDTSCWCLSYTDGSVFGDNNAFSRLCGKHLIAPVPKEKSGFWGFTEKAEEKCLDFIIGVDDNGEEILHTCDHKSLSNNFGANPEAPHYLTPVHFKKAVLDKYHGLSSKFSVDDSCLWCGYLWSMQMDNHHADKVCVWLGDLGRDLPYEEQLHWRSYNIAPIGTVSDVYFKRQIMAEFANSDQPEHIFRHNYKKLHEACIRRLNWQLLLPLGNADKHYLAAIRIPTTEEQSDFDELILALTKILVDSLNEKKLKSFIPKEERGEIKGSVSRLEHALQTCRIDDYEEHIQYLRNLQNLRSAGTAHRKGSNYKKIAEEMGIYDTSLNEVFTGILTKANDLLQFLEEATKHLQNNLTETKDN